MKVFKLRIVCATCGELFDHFTKNRGKKKQYCEYCLCKRINYQRKAVMKKTKKKKKVIKNALTGRFDTKVNLKKKANEVYKQTV